MRELEPEVVEIEGVRIVTGSKKFGDRYVDGFHLPGGLFTKDRREAVKTMKTMRYYADSVKLKAPKINDGDGVLYTDTP